MHHVTAVFYTRDMTIHPTPELEAKLTEIARRTGRDVNAIAQEALEQYIDHYGWFSGKVAEGLTALERGEVLTHEEVGQRIERLFP